jgi:G6PDH family F420-dependent oxidoreductase
MAHFGFTLSSEEFGPRALVDNARRAEAAGFDFLSISDHFHPWIAEQGHSPFVWSVLGAVAEATERVQVGIGVTCPTIRIHPAVIAHAAATTSLLFGDRFFLGVGTGEALNEHVLGHRWPPYEVRENMLREAVEVIRTMWKGDVVDFHGEFYTVENAQLYDAPETDVPIIVSGFNVNAVEMAAEIGDGLWSHGTDRSLLERYEAAGGTGPRYTQASVCWAADAASARRTVHRVWPNSALPGTLNQDLPTTSHFESAVKLVDEETAVGSTPCGPDVDAYVESVQQFLDAGFDHVYFHQIGPDQEGFLRFWERELQPALRDLRHAA